MRKIFSFIMATVDGYSEGPNQEFDFFTIDDEFEEFSLEQLDEVDTLVFGRATYEGMAAYWPTRAAQIPRTRRTRATQAAARQGHRESRRLRSDGEPPADGAGRRTAGHDEPRRSRRRRSVFRTTTERISLKLLRSRSFASGNVLLYYQPAALAAGAHGSL